MADVEEGNQDWKATVSTYSDAPLKAEGGDLGWLSTGQIAPAMEKPPFYAMRWRGMP